VVGQSVGQAAFVASAGLMAHRFAIVRAEVQ